MIDAFTLVLGLAGVVDMLVILWISGRDYGSIADMGLRDNCAGSGDFLLAG